MPASTMQRGVTLTFLLSYKFLHGTMLLALIMLILPCLVWARVFGLYSSLSSIHSAFLTSVGFHG